MSWNHSEAPLSLFRGVYMKNNDIPFISHMYTVIEKVINEYNIQNGKTDISYNNFSLDSDSEYCQNTTAWD